MLIDIDSITLVVQLFLLVADIILNTIVNIFFLSPQVQVAVYMVQTILLLLAASSFCVLFCSSWYYVSGLLTPIFRLFGGIVLCWSIYFGLTLGMHVWAITAWYQSNLSVAFTPGFRALFTIQRLFSYIYYYTYMRKVLSRTHRNANKLDKRPLVKDVDGPIRPVQEQFHHSVINKKPTSS